MSEWPIAADLRKLIDFFKKMLSDDSANPSTKRWLAWIMGTSVAFTWSYLSIHNDKMMEIPWEVAALVCALAGVVMFGKYGETKPPQGG